MQQENLESRADEYIARAKKNTMPGRYNLRWLLVSTLLLSALLAVFRAAGLLNERWPQYLLLAVGIGAFLAPMLCFTIAAYFNKTRLHHLCLALVGACALLGFFMVLSVAVAKADGGDMIAISVAAGCAWSLQVAAISLVNWGVFRSSVPRRTFPAEVHKTHRDAS